MSRLSDSDRFNVRQPFSDLQRVWRPLWHHCSQSSSASQSSLSIGRCSGDWTIFSIAPAAAANRMAHRLLFNALGAMLCALIVYGAFVAQ
jgi:hypothetical protein